MQLKQLPPSLSVPACRICLVWKHVLGQGLGNLRLVGGGTLNRNRCRGLVWIKSRNNVKMG